MPAATNTSRGFFALAVIFRGRVGVHSEHTLFPRFLILPMSLARTQQNEANKTRQEDVGLESNPSTRDHYEKVVNWAAHAERQSAVEPK